MRKNNNTRTILFMAIILSVIFLSSCNDLQSNDIATCQRGIDSAIKQTIESGNTTHLRDVYTMLDDGKIGNISAVNERLITLATDPATPPDIKKYAEKMIFDICNKTLVSNSDQALMSDSRVPGILVDWTKNAPSDADWVSNLFLEGDFPPSAQVVDFLVDNGSVGDYFLTHTDSLTITEFFNRVFITHANDYAGTTSMLETLQLQNMKLSQAIVDFWSSYYEKYGMAKIDTLYLGLEMQLGNDYQISIVPVNGYEGIEKYEKYQGGSFSEEVNTASLDNSKIAVIKVVDKPDGTSGCWFSPYTFFLVPGENRIQLDNLYGAGTVICIHYAPGASASYTGGVTGYQLNAVITKVDLVNKTVSPSITIIGRPLPQTIIPIDPSSTKYFGDPPAQIDIAPAVLYLLGN